MSIHSHVVADLTLSKVTCLYQPCAGSLFCADAKSGEEDWQGRSTETDSRSVTAGPEEFSWLL